MQAGALAAVGLIITVAVYGAVGLIVKLDDIGLHMAERKSAATRAFGRGLVHVVPALLAGLSGIGTAAMLWVGGGILIHGLEDLHILTAIPEGVHDLAHSVAHGSAFLNWLVTAVAGAVVGIIVGAVIVAVLHLIPKKGGQKTSAH